MYRNLIVLTLFLIFGLAAAGAETLIAPLYPGAVAYGPENPGYFLSKDSYEQVKAFYHKNKGAPAWEKEHKEQGWTAFFEYMSVVEVHKYDPVGSAIGVRVIGKNPDMYDDVPVSTLPVVGEIFNNIKMLMMQQDLPDMSEYNNLVDKYRHLSCWYFPLIEDPDAPGTFISMDELILKQCTKNPGEQKSEQNMQDLAKKAEELMKQGKQREALELLQQVGHAAQNEVARSTGSPGIEKWKQGLVKLQEKGFPTRIEIAPHP
ncbi:MAG: hypothetical protein LC660_03665 [Desulfobacteraceae bacterium]|nr:hypothetical protein [Desulfobacteraceae bacterium]